MTDKLKEPALLRTALRQYSHNHGEGFVFGYDKEETDRIVAGLVEDRNQQYAMQVGFCEDTALSLAERTFSTEVDEQLAEDIIQYARRLHSRYTAPQPELKKLVEALEEMIYLANMVDNWESFPFYPIERAEEALANYRKLGGK